MHTAHPDDTGTLTVPTAAPTLSASALRAGFDDEIRQDIRSAAWMIAVVTIPGIALALSLL